MNIPHFMFSVSGLLAHSEKNQDQLLKWAEPETVGQVSHEVFPNREN